MSVISIILVLIIAFLAGLDGILDQYQFHQPLVSCTLIGLVTGHLEAGLMLGGALQMIALGWANIGAAVAPDIALAATAASVIMIKGGDFTKTGVGVAQAVAIPLAVAGLALTMIVRTISVAIVHGADSAAKNGNIRAVETAHFTALILQGLRIMLPIALLLALPTETVQAMLNAIPAWLKDGMTIGGGMVVAVGYAMVINMMATRETWPFFALGFVFAAVGDFTLIALGTIGVAIALIYLNLSEKGGSGTGGNAGGGSGEKIQLTKSDRRKVWWRSTFLQGSWNYERMQNLGWAYSLIPAIKKLYTTKEDRAAALERHLEFFNTHPYVAAPIMGVTLALEEEKANGAEIDDTAIQGVKIGMMGPLAGIGDPVFWFTVRPILGALGASLASAGNIVGPLIFFFGWNIIRMAFLWYTQEFGYKAGSEITKDLSGGLLQKITKGASILGMFILAALVERWVNVTFTLSLPSTQLSKGAYIEFPNGAVTGGKLQEILGQVQSGLSLTQEKANTLQGQLDSLIPGLMGLLLTFLCMWLLKKKVSPIVMIIGLFIVGIVAHVIGLM